MAMLEELLKMVNLMKPAQAPGSSPPASSGGTSATPVQVSQTPQPQVAAPVNPQYPGQAAAAAGGGGATGGLSSLMKLPMPGSAGNVGQALGSGVSAVGGAAKDVLKSAGGMLCCFIFIEANGGTLHPVVRMYRDEHMTARNRRGYYRLADRLVPKMKQYKLVYHAVRLFMTEPMTSYGKYFYGIGRAGKVFKPLAKFWLKVFDRMGSGKYTRFNGEVL